MQIFHGKSAENLNFVNSTLQLHPYMVKEVIDFVQCRTKCGVRVPLQSNHEVCLLMAHVKSLNKTLVGLVAKVR